MSSHLSRTSEVTLLRAEQAPDPRTLIDIFQETVEANPDRTAIDSGAEMLTCTEFSDATD